MTTITIKNDANFEFSQTDFHNSRELLDFLIEKLEITTTSAVADDEISPQDRELMEIAKTAEWSTLHNI